MDSISYITKKHCRSILNLLSIALLLLMAGIAFTGFSGAAGVISTAIFALMALLSVIVACGMPIGCTLLQIPLVIIAFVSFFGGIVTGAIGFAIEHYRGICEYLNALYIRNHYEPLSSPHGQSALLCIGTLILFSITFFSFCVIKYLNTIKKCLNNSISRHGARILSVTAIFMMFLFMGIACFFMVGCGGWAVVKNSRSLLSVFAELIIVAVLMLLTCLSAASFVNVTFAFKVYEDKVMKVETNADGTMYVPILEDSDGNSSVPVPLPIPIPAPQSDAKPKKAYIMEFGELKNSEPINGAHSEYDIL